MAGRALTLRVAGGTEVGLCVGLHAVLTQEVAIVNHVAFRQRHLPGQVHVTPTAVTRVPLALVRVTAETSGMLHTEVVGIDRYVDVATDAVAGACLAMLCVRKPKVAARHLGSVPISRASVAVSAGVRIVWLLMALYAVSSRRKMQRTRISGLGNPGVAFQAVDALDEMSPMLERVVLSLLLEAEHLGARAGRSSQHQEGRDCDPPSHRLPRQAC